MIDADRDAYRAALEPHARRAEREAKQIDHVRWDRGHAEVVLVPRGYGMTRAEPPADDQLL
jgi:hypothetical protein